MDFIKLLKRSKSIHQRDKSEENRNERNEQSDDFADAIDLNLNEKIQSNATSRKQFHSSQKGWRRSFHRLKKKKSSNFTSNSYEDILQNHEVAFTNNPTVSTSNSKRGTNRWSYSPGVTPEYETNSFLTPQQPCTNTDYRDHVKQYDRENGNLEENLCDKLVEGTYHQENGHTTFWPSTNHGMLPHQSTNSPLSSHAGSVRRLEYVTEIEQQESHKAHSLSHLIPKSMLIKQDFQFNSAPNVNFCGTNANVEIDDTLERRENSETLGDKGDGSNINTEGPPNNDFAESPAVEEVQNPSYNSSDSYYDPSRRTWSKASSRYERETDDVLDNLEGRGDGYEQHTHTDDCHEFEQAHDMYEQPEDFNSEDNLSWGSQEFETDSNESGVYENDQQNNQTQNKPPPKSEGNKSTENNNIFWKHREIGKDISKGVLKLLERKDRRTVSKKNSREEEPSSFVDTCMSSERYRGPHLQDPPSNLNPNQLLRRRILETIINSESSYIDSLERLEIDYKKALLDCKPPIINADTVERIFYKISDILQCHQLFQLALAESVRSWDEREMIGHTFVASFSKSMVVECYSGYINNFTNATDLVHKTCLRKPQFLSFLQERQYENSNQLDVYGLMLKPVQRFPQFIMIVQDLLKHTPRDHRDRLQLQFALNELEALTDNLNLRRENEEQKAEMVRLLESSNIKLIPPNVTLQGHSRKVLKQGLLRERTYSDEGTLEKERECLIVLTNDLLICCSAANKKHPSKLGNLTLRDLYKMKWSAPLDILTIKSSLDQSNDRDSEAMERDYEILEKIKHLVDNLYFSYDKLSSHQVEMHMQTLETKITLAQALSQHSQENHINVTFPQKSGEIRRALLPENDSDFYEWLESINNAKLANEPKNLHCWYSADGSESGFLWKAPLFLEYFDIQPNNMQIQCAHAFMPVSQITSLWLACSASTVLAVVNIYQSVGGKMEKVHVMQVESSVQCMEHWNPSGDYDSVWLGMECGSLIEFSTDVTYSKMCEITLPTMSTVMIMKGLGSNLYVGLLDCTLIMYNRPEGLTGLDMVRTIAVGSGHLTCLSHINGRLCGFSGNDLVYINRNTLEVESVSAIPADKNMIVSNVVVAGTGLWVAFSETCNLHLYHLDTLNLLQDLNLNRPIRDYFQNQRMSKLSNYPCHVTSLWSSYWQLVVGTSNGLILIFPLPKLMNSVPKITGPCRICYHTMTGPVRFICAPEIPNRVDLESYDTKLKMPKLNSPIAELGNLESIIESETRVSNTLHKRRRSESSIILPNRFTNSAVSNRMNRREMSLEKRKSTSAVPGQVLFPRDVVSVKEVGSETNHQDESKKKSWKKGRVKSHPLLLACGEGYKYLGRHKDSGTTVLCWKIT